MKYLLTSDLGRAKKSLGTTALAQQLAHRQSGTDNAFLILVNRPTSVYSSTSLS